MNAGNNGENDEGTDEEENTTSNSGIEKHEKITAFQKKVATLIAGSSLSIPQIAKTLGTDTGSVYALRSQPWFQHYVQLERAKIFTDTGGMALSVAKDIMLDESSPPHIRAKLATWWVDEMRITPKAIQESAGGKSGDAAASGKQLGEMTVDELHKFVANAQQILERDAVIIENPPETGD